MIKRPYEKPVINKLRSGLMNKFGWSPAYARKVRTAVIVHRLRADSRHTPTIHGFVYPGAEWLVGYGLRDSDSKLMNTRFIGRLPGTP